MGKWVLRKPFWRVIHQVLYVLFVECKSLSTAPPSIICQKCRYNKETNTCTLPLISKEETEDIHLTVEFSGVGPFSVVWYHNGDVLECSNNTEDTTQCSVKRFFNSTYGYEVEKLYCFLCVGYIATTVSVELEFGGGGGKPDQFVYWPITLAVYWIAYSEFSWVGQARLLK